MECGPSTKNSKRERPTVVSREWETQLNEVLSAHGSGLLFRELRGNSIIDGAQHPVW